MTTVKFPTFTRTDRQLSLLLGATTLALYLRTLAPGLLPGDAGEFQFAAWRLGLAHPTGYPLYLLSGWAWQHMLAWVGISPATALNALSALFATVGVLLCYRLVLGWMPGPSGLRRIAALYSALILAGNLTYWSQALIAEVYALHMVLILALLLASQRLIAQPTPRRLIIVAAFAGLSLTHHAMSLLLLPPLLLYLVQFPGVRQTMQASFRSGLWLLISGVGLLPLLLYLYIPWRSGPDASPWYHQRLGDTVLQLYNRDWVSFWAYISGQSIAVGFRDIDGAIGQLNIAGWLWQEHFGWIGLALVAIGLFWLWRTGQRALLGLTLSYVLIQQTFNLFYDIGDILVYYIPLYWVGAVWAGAGVAGLASGHWRRDEPQKPAQNWLGVHPLGWLIALAVILLAVRDLPGTAAQIDQSGTTNARTTWEAILAAQPPDNAILISNDRNEIVPLFYLQAVEGRASGHTGLFPGIAPDDRFANVGATVATALTQGDDQPVFLIKPMPGLAVRYRMQAATPPLMEVVAEASATPPAVSISAGYGPMTLIGYTLYTAVPGQDDPDGPSWVELYWRVDTPLATDYTATLQLLDNSGNKIAQDDHPPGGIYYPTSQWQPGVTYVVRHPLDTDQIPPDALMLAGFYHSDNQTLLEPLLEIMP